jgi:hypothetical protein
MRKDSEGMTRRAGIPTAFRASIARSRHSSVHGGPAGILAVFAREVPAVDVALPEGGRALPGGIFRFRTSNQHFQLFMTTLSLPDCDQFLTRSLRDRARARTRPPTLAWRRVGLHHDPLTEVTVVHTFTPLHDVFMAHQTMERMLEVLVAAEMMRGLDADVWAGPTGTLA